MTVTPYDRRKFYIPYSVQRMYFVRCVIHRGKQQAWKLGHFQLASRPFEEVIAQNTLSVPQYLSRKVHWLPIENIPPHIRSHQEES